MGTHIGELRLAATTSGDGGGGGIRSMDAQVDLAVRERMPIGILRLYLEHGVAVLCHERAGTAGAAREVFCAGTVYRADTYVGAGSRRAGARTAASKHDSKDEKVYQEYDR